VPQELVPSPYSWAPELQPSLAEYLAQIQLEPPLRFHLVVVNRRFALLVNRMGDRPRT
jgi:hypothetical protein